MKWDELTAKKAALDAKRPFSPELVANLLEWFRVELTYTSNAIEGNTLTRRETALVIEKGLTIGGKTLREHIEATNHAKAFSYINGLISKKPRHLTENDILGIHELILSNIDGSNAGCYRTVGVRISGSSVVMPNFRKVPELMAEFVSWFQTAKGLHPVQLASEAHYQLVTVHPFVDGNGRTGRLLMNLFLTMYGYPPAIIRPRDRLAYIGSLESAQLGGSKEPYEKIIFRAVERSLNLYLSAVLGDEPLPTRRKSHSVLLKIGQLAKAAGVTVPTIRFWTKEGLLDVASVKESGYQMYDPAMIVRCRQIQQLKEKRLTIAEIKSEFDNK